MKRLAILTTHPIQYYAPVFKLLAAACDLKVFYTWGEAGVKDKHDPGFGRKISWDLPLLEGYAYEFLKNTAPAPGSGHFKGIQNPDLIARIHDFKPDAILVYGWSYQSHLKAMRHFKGKVPLWFRGDSNLLDRQPFWKKRMRSVLLRWVYRHIDLAFYVGTANKAYYKAFGLTEKQLRFAPHAIDNERFAASRQAETKTLRDGLSIPDNATFILFAGKLEPKKNPELLLRAFIKWDQLNSYLVFAGNGMLEQTLKSQVSTLNSSNVRFLDFQNQTQMPVLYQACDVFCLPSKGPGETWGLAVNEAMAAGKAVLVSDQVGCAKDLVRPGHNGLIFKNNDEADLLEKLHQLSFLNLDDLGKRSKAIIAGWNFKEQVSVFLSTLYR